MDSLTLKEKINFIKNQYQQCVTDKNDLLATCISLLNGVKNGDIVIYPKHENTFDYLSHLDKITNRKKVKIFKEQKLDEYFSDLIQSHETWEEIAHNMSKELRKRLD